jgi:hypothetical protein
MKQIINLVASFSKLPDTNQDYNQAKANYKSKLHAIVDNVWNRPEVEQFSVLYPKLISAFIPIFSNLDETIIQDQNRERFHQIESDIIWIKFLKFNKKLAFGIYGLPFRMANLVRKRKSKISYWSHAIPLKNLAITHFQAGLIFELQTVTRLFFTHINKQYLEIKNWENELSESVIVKKKGSKTSLIKKIDQFSIDLLSEIDETLIAILEKKSKQFGQDYERAGTLEFPNRHLSNRYTIKHLQTAEINWGKNRRDWKNASYALFEEWRSDLDIYILKYKALAELKEFQSGQIRKLGEFIDPEINAIRKFIEDASQSLELKQDSITKTLKKINYQAKKSLDKELVPRLCDKLSGHDITNLINKLEVNIRKSVEDLSDEHVIVKSTNYDNPIKSDDLASISPYELIAFETLAGFQEDLKLIKKELFSALDKATSGSTDLDHIITFSITTAIASIVEEGKSEQEALIIAKDGLRRALNRLNENRQGLESSMLENSHQLEEIVVKFCEKIMELTVNENVGELRLRITKAKASKQAEAVRVELSEKFKLQKSVVIDRITSGYEKLGSFLNALGDRFILTSKKPTLTKEVSDFLMESRIAIDRLPLIYRRLYQIEPLKDLELFVGRENELDKFKLALQNWNQGRYATTVILGEKWSGLSTFLNYAIKEMKMPYSVIRLAATENISTEEKFFEFFHGIYKNEKPVNLDQLVSLLNEGTKKLIVLEDLQNMYLRKVNGFIALQTLFELITRTNQNIFWVSTTTIYTWSYLSKTINISEFFSYNIEMENLTSEQMISIIWKRNRISGFNIQFEPSVDQAEDKKFSKLNHVDQQLMLKESFFEGLNEFAKSNVSLALIFWLLSTKGVDENTITIGSFNKPNLSFLKVLSMNKLHALHALILHDGLTCAQVSEVINITLTDAKLMLLAMIEDGIIFIRDDIFMVNSIVYRDTISLLKSRNLIH